MLFFLAQHFWFIRANRIIDRVGSPNWRRWTRVLLHLAAAFVVVSFADRLFLHLFPRPSVVSWFMGLAQLWLFASSVAFLAVKAVHAAEWAWNFVLPESHTLVGGTVIEDGMIAADVDPSGAIVLAGRPREGSVDPGRRRLFRYAASLAACIPFAAGIYGFASERLRYTVQRVDIPIPNLPPSLDGLRIVQMSDIHIGDFMPREEVRRAVSMANELGADLAILTGDYVTGSRDPLEDCIAELSALHAPLGVWGCNGNHEVYADAEDQAEELFERYGMRMLRQRNAQLEWCGAKFNLIGVDYQREFFRFGGRMPMLQSAERLVRRDMPNILLSHNPNSFYRAAELGIELSLAGHTHGGQIQIEIVDHRWSPARFMTSFVAGLYHLPSRIDVPTGPGTAANRASLYVNRGLGTIGIPARLGAEPEISLLTLRRA